VQHPASLKDSEYKTKVRLSSAYVPKCSLYDKDKIQNCRTMKKTILLFVLSLLLVPAIAQVTVEAGLDTTSILIGEQVQLRVKCAAGARQQVEFPFYQAQQEITPGVEVVNNGRVDTLYSNNGKRMELTRRYTITAFDSALYQLPPITVKVDGKEYVCRNKIGLKVSTVAVDTVHVDKFNGPHDVVDLPFEWSWRTTLLSLLSILLALVTFTLSVRLSDPKLITRRVVIHPPTPAHVTALNSIERLKQKAAPDPKAYYMDLTETLRAYIERRFGFNAKEMTTSQIIDELTATERADALSELKDILVTADLVKFAKHTTSLPEQERSLLQALDYVQATKQNPEDLPKPRVEYETLSGRRQRQLRMVMKAGAVLSAAASIGITAYVICDLHSCYGI